MKRKRGRPRKEPMSHEVKEAFLETEAATGWKYFKDPPKKKKTIGIKGLYYPSSVELLQLDDDFWQVIVKEKPSLWQRIKNWFK